MGGRSCLLRVDLSKSSRWRFGSPLLIVEKIIESDDSSADYQRHTDNPDRDSSDHGAMLLRDGLSRLSKSFHPGLGGAQLGNQMSKRWS